MITEGWQPSELHGILGPPKPPRVLPPRPAPLECPRLTWNPWHKSHFGFNKILHALPRYWLVCLGRASRTAALWKFSQMVPKAAWWILNNREAPRWGILGNRTNDSVATERINAFKILFNSFLLRIPQSWLATVTQRSLRGNKGWEMDFFRQ